MSRATELGTALGLDVEGSRRRHAAARARYRAAITAALDRLLEVEQTFTQPREPMPYAAAGMSYPFERREVYACGQTATAGSVLR